MSWPLGGNPAKSPRSETETESNDSNTCKRFRREVEVSQAANGMFPSCNGSAASDMGRRDLDTIQQAQELLQTELMKARLERNDLARERAEVFQERAALRSARAAVDAEHEAVRQIRQGLMRQLSSSSDCSSRTAPASLILPSSSRPLEAGAHKAPLLAGENHPGVARQSPTGVPGMTMELDSL
eukprot:CAMPEP_0172593962 /NCGR_PEP_ID=MMETSP1068-20121228/13216_1 /TAXON_ID=35684 /ORGANISM="Pseudopedinella elastica, Strain CCMP716" /LENGTH=183 /DNA_ID=CAMNT_0013391699 /DNA_START=127 /DNA_END=678 /DNA_ORIENTATION=+